VEVAVFLPLVLALCSPVFAQDIPEEEEELDIPEANGPTTTGDQGFDLGESKFSVRDADEDVGMVDYAAEALKRPADPMHFHLDPTGRSPLSNDYPMQVVAIGPTWVKMELPVLVANDRASFEMAYPHGLRIITEWDVGGEKQVVEHVVRAAGLRPGAPTFAFFDVAVQDSRKSAPVRVLVKTAAMPDPAATGAAEAPKDRYAVTSVFYRKG
jgi:hypothetical protein